MTPDEHLRLLRSTSKDVDAVVLAAYESLIRKIRGGMDPRQAVDEAMASFGGKFAAVYAAGLSKVLDESVGSASAISAPVGNITLSQRLYAQSQALSGVVTGVVRRHVRGLQDARSLALELYEGYDFREDEVLKIAKGNRQLPKYMREALLDDEPTARGLRRAFARIQVESLKTPALRTAYRDVLDGIDKVESGPAATHLEKKLKVAFYERTRYFAKRIAETELHRNFAIQQARELMGDDDVQFVQWRLSPSHPIEDICDYFAGADLYGLGPGVYPKSLAPVAPAHPHCKCVLSPRLDLNDKAAQEKEGAEDAFFAQYGESLQRRIAGSKGKLERIKRGESAWDVHNASIDPLYQVKQAGSV